MCLAADQAMHRDNTVIGSQALLQSNIIVSLPLVFSSLNVPLSRSHSLRIHRTD